jgi:hypothetical protein
LQIVDGQDDRPVIGEPAQRVEHGAAAVEEVGVPIEHRRRHQLGVEVLEEVEQTDHQGLQLLFGGPGDEDEVTRGAHAVESRPPDERLADARLTADQQGARSSRRRRRDEPLDARQFGVPPRQSCPRSRRPELGHFRHGSAPLPEVFAAAPSLASVE